MLMSHIVLLVEEDEAVAEMISEVLQQQPGCTLLWVREHDLALQLLRHDFRPHHILLDLAVPYTSGLAFHDRLQENPATASIPLVVLASHPTDASLATRQFAAVLPKPFELTTLETALNLSRPLRDGSEAGR
jgi:CheY-like chemotaxis protein